MKVLLNKIYLKKFIAFHGPCKNDNVKEVVQEIAEMVSQSQKV